MKDDIYVTNDIETIKENSPVFFDALNRRALETVLVSRIGMLQNTYGYLICAEPRSHRIWQDYECAIVYFLAKLIATGIYNENAGTFKDGEQRK